MRANLHALGALDDIVAAGVAQAQAFAGKKVNLQLASQTTYVVDQTVVFDASQGASLVTLSSAGTGTIVKCADLSTHAFQVRGFVAKFWGMSTGIHERASS